MSTHLGCALITRGARGGGGGSSRSTRAVAVTRIRRAQLAVKDGGAMFPDLSVPRHGPIPCGCASPEGRVRSPANTAGVRAPASPRKRRPRGSTQGYVGGGAGATPSTGGAASRLPRPSRQRRHCAGAWVELVVRVAESQPRAGGARAGRAGGGRADAQPFPGRPPAGGRGTYPAAHPFSSSPRPRSCFLTVGEHRSWGSVGERSDHRIRRSRAPGTRIRLWLGRASHGSVDHYASKRGLCEGAVVPVGRRTWTMRCLRSRAPLRGLFPPHA